jgi:acyl-CoA synthetase (AMP-forming)/AMP-acid ligase II
VGVWDRLRLAQDSNLTLSSLPSRLASAHGNRLLAVEGISAQWSANDVDRLTARWCSALSKVLVPGERVVVALPNGYEFFMAFLAVCRAGGVAVPVNDRTTADELAHIVVNSGASLLVRTVAELESPLRIEAGAGSKAGSKPASKKRSQSGTQAQSGEAETNSQTEDEPKDRPVDQNLADSALHWPTSPSDVAAIFFTSGTTGKPKGAELSHRGLLAGTQKLAALPMNLRNDEAIVALPVAHIMGFAAYLGAALMGLQLYVHERFSAEAVLDSIETRRASGFIGVPAMYRMLEEAGAASRDLSSVRLWMSGADAMPPELVRSFQSYGATVTIPFLGTSIGEAAFVEGYGMVELSGGAAVKVTPPFAGSLLSKPIGIPLPSNKLRVVDDNNNQVRIGKVGELLVKGPGVLQRYRNDEAATDATMTADGWLRTGDLAKRQPFGAVEFVGRAKDVIKVGGYSVFAAEVQAVLETFDGVAEASVVGLPDTRMGESVAVALRQLSDSPPIDLEAVKALATEKLAKYKVPRHWLIVDELPRTGSSKVQRQAVRDLFVSERKP